MDPRPHIVVVEDEAAQRQLLADYLAGQNFRVSAVDGGAGLHRLIEREVPALVLLDVGLPGEDGFALARWLREKSSRVGIIMVTSAADTIDRVVGLETGADDYVTKPFEPRELLARVKSVLRRGAADRDVAPARHIAAILTADVAGYSRLVGADEEGTLAAIRTLRRELIDPNIAEHRGRIVKTTGDGILVEFASAIGRIERDYQELKQELGLGDCERRGWRGFHHHASLCIAAYGFLIAERGALPPSVPGSPRRSRDLPFPRVIDPEAPPIRPERHIPNSIATVRKPLIIALARTPPRCPCCNTPIRKMASIPDY